MDRTNVTVTKLKKSDFSTEGLLQDLNRLLKFKDSQQQDANAFPETRKDVAMTSLAAIIKYIALLSESTNFGRFEYVLYFVFMYTQVFQSIPKLLTEGHTT